MDIPVARSTALSRRQKALKSAASAVALLAVGGVFNPTLAEDWYWVGGATGGALTFSNWKADSYIGGAVENSATFSGAFHFNKSVVLSDDIPNVGALTVNITSGNMVTMTGRLVDRGATSPSTLTVTGGTLILTNDDNTLSGTVTIRRDAALQIGNSDNQFNIDTGTIDSTLFVNDGTLTLINRRETQEDGTTPKFVIWDSGEIKRSDQGTQTDGKFIIRVGMALRVDDNFKIAQSLVIVAARYDANNQKIFSILELGDLKTAPLIGQIAVGGILRFNNMQERSISTTITNWTPLGQNQPTYVGDVVKIGTGKLNLTGAHTYSGTTRIEAGTLNLLTKDAIKNSSRVSVLALGTLSMNGLEQSFKVLQINGGSLMDGTIAITGAEAAITVNGGLIQNIVASNVALNLEAGTNKLVGASTFGAVVVKSGATLHIYNNGDQTTTLSSLILMPSHMQSPR